MTTYIWGITNQKFEVKACYEFIKDYYDGWFPDLPSYQAYSNRICYLADAFKELANMFLCGMGLDASHSDYIIDSVPIILASHKRSRRGKVASELCDKGYCASKELHYYGMKLHILAQCNYKAMPTPAVMTTSKASCRDLPIAKEMLGDIFNIRAFGDKAFIDKLPHLNYPPVKIKASKSTPRGMKPLRCIFVRFAIDVRIPVKQCLTRTSQSLFDSFF
ncbi:MAG: hypothetical protein FWC70_06635 [Defluviitaleaceae bacterium]|nr:hypothetical protein [Defluviitaleaceae bacterium]